MLAGRQDDIFAESAEMFKSTKIIFEKKGRVSHAVRWGNVSLDIGT
jgi:hypothetical protein